MLTVGPKYILFDEKPVQRVYQEMSRVMFGGCVKPSGVGFWIACEVACEELFGRKAISLQPTNSK